MIYIFGVFLSFFTISGRNICDSLYYDVRLLISLQYCIFDPVVVDRIIYFTQRRCSPEQYRRCRFIIQQTVRICFLMETKTRHAFLYILIKKCHRCIYLTMNNGYPTLAFLFPLRPKIKIKEREREKQTRKITLRFFRGLYAFHFFSLYLREYVCVYIKKSVPAPCLQFV